MNTWSHQQDQDHPSRRDQVWAPQQFCSSSEESKEPELCFIHFLIKYQTKVTFPESFSRTLVGLSGPEGSSFQLIGLYQTPLQADPQEGEEGSSAPEPFRIKEVNFRTSTVCCWIQTFCFLWRVQVSVEGPGLSPGVSGGVVGSSDRYGPPSAPSSSSC